MALTLIGGLTTIPLALNVLGKKGTTTAEIRPAHRSAEKNKSQVHLAEFLPH